jgi:SET domain-containing protein
MRVLETSTVIVKPSKSGGRGLFARRVLEPGDLIERCAVLLRPYHALKRDACEHHFEWDDDSGALALGVTSLVNHSYTPNADYNFDVEGLQMTLVATKRIEVLEEVVVNYNGDQDDMSPLWFDVL